MGISSIVNYKRRLRFRTIPKVLKFALIGLVSLVIIWTIVALFEDRTPFQIIILNKKEHVSQPEGTGGWSISGFVYYENLNESPLKSINIAKPRPYNGLWVFRKNQSSSENLNKESVIRLTGFQHKRPKEVTLGLRYYISGAGRIEITLRGALTDEYEILALFQDEDDLSVAQGFCSKIISPGFNKQIDMIEIRPFTLTATSMVVIDEVILTMAHGDSSKHLMYTLIPNEWCEVKNQNTNGNSNSVLIKLEA